MGMRKAKTLKSLISSPKGLRKLAEQMLAPLKKDLKYDGRIKGLFDRYNVPCALCKILKINHRSDTQEHPWFANNLEYLEWKYERTKSDL